MSQTPRGGRITVAPSSVTNGVARLRGGQPGEESINSALVTKIVLAIPEAFDYSIAILSTPPPHEVTIMKRSITCAGLLLTVALASAQGVVPKGLPPIAPPTDFGPEDPTQKKNSLPELPGVRGLITAPEGRFTLEQPKPTMPARGLGELPARERYAIPMPSHSAIERTLGKPGERNADLFRLIPNEKTNRLAPLPVANELQNSKPSTYQDLPRLSPVIPNRGQFALPSVPSSR